MRNKKTKRKSKSKKKTKSKRYHKKTTFEIYKQLILHYKKKDYLVIFVNADGTPAISLSNSV